MKYVCLMVVAVLLASCSEKDKKPYVERPAEELYERGMDSFHEKRYDDAVSNFDDLERQHPYSKLVPVAMIKSAYSSYRAMKYDDAVLTLERFIQLFPGNKYAPYAMYMKAMCYYERIVDVEREQKMTNMSREAFSSLISRFPDSVYAKDARLKMDFTRSHLAGKEMEIGRYYLFRNNYTAAMNHFTEVINKYQETVHVAEALYRMVELYLSVGIDDEVLKMAAILGKNYPASVWYRRAYDLMSLRKKELEEKEAMQKLIKPDDIDKLPKVDDNADGGDSLVNPPDETENADEAPVNGNTVTDGNTTEIGDTSDNAKDNDKLDSDKGGKEKAAEE